MKKKLSLLVACAMMISLFSFVSVNAADISAASEITGPGEYVLTGDTDGPITCDKAGTYDIDLNGYTVSGQIRIGNKDAKVIVRDSSDEETGKISMVENDCAVINAGSLTLESGMIEAQSAGKDGVWIEGNGSFTMNGGKVFGANAGIQNRLGTVVVNDGEVTSPHVALKVSGKGTDLMYITINGGTFFSGRYMDIDEGGGDVANGICLNVNESAPGEQGYILGDGVKLDDDGAGTYVASGFVKPTGDPSDPTPTKDPSAKPTAPSGDKQPNTGDADFIVAALAVVAFAGAAIVLIRRKACR